MTELIKSRWETEGDTLRFSVPLEKVDADKRLVSGWATLDNVDTQGDIVLAEASRKAFSRARGNLREMHQPLAVGKIVDFREDEFYNKSDGKFYRGIYVTARVSEGAQDTWAKVLDGTLTGFSIGGSVIEASNEMSKDGTGPVRLIKDYDLVELSLVDNPANQLSNITGFQKSIFTLNKSNGSVTVEGMVAETDIENVFICSNDDNIVSKSDESVDCPKCGDAMKNIGWFEAGKNRAEKVREIVAKFNAPDTDIEGGVEMGKENITKAAETEGTENVTEAEEVVETPTAVDGETGETSDGEEAVEVSEVTDEEEVISKKIDELKNVVTETLEKTRTETHNAVNSLDEKVVSLAETFEKSIAKANEDLETLKTQFESFNQSLETEKSKLASLEDRLSKMNSSEAFRKSADLVDESTVITKQKKPTWDGAFSIDNLR